MVATEIKSSKFFQGLLTAAPSPAIAENLSSRMLATTFATSLSENGTRRSTKTNSAKFFTLDPSLCPLSLQSTFADQIKGGFPIIQGFAPLSSILRRRRRRPPYLGCQTPEHVRGVFVVGRGAESPEGPVVEIAQGSSVQSRAGVHQPEYALLTL